MVAGEPGADQGDGQAREAGGAPKAHAGNTPTPETEAGDLEADPGIVMCKSLPSFNSVFVCVKT